LLLLINEPKKEGIWEETSVMVLDILISSLINARFGKHPTLWLISPWITDVKFNFKGRSTLSSLFIKSKRSIRLTEILQTYLNYGAELNIICRPPHELFDFNKIRLLLFLCQFSQPPSEFREYTKYTLLGDILAHKATIDFLYSITRASTQCKPNIGYLEKLHSKIIYNGNHAIFGSSNITHGGIYYNCELNTIISERILLDKISCICNELWKNSTTIKDYASQDNFRKLMHFLEAAQNIDPLIKELYNKIKWIHRQQIQNQIS